MINGLPQRLHILRVQHGFSQRQVAERLGVSPSIVSGYETGERTPSVEMLLALAYLFNCSTDYLLGKKTSQQSLLLNLDGLNDAQIAAISAVIAAMRSKEC